MKHVMKTENTNKHYYMTKQNYDSKLGQSDKKMIFFKRRIDESNKIMSPYVTKIGPH